MHAWLSGLGTATRIVSVFLGGGTPSIYINEYADLFALIKPYLLPGAETTIEANPDDITLDSLSVWRGVGFRRISLGVQTFSAEGLRFMHRSHSADLAAVAIEKARSHFDNVNVDLIYGWPNQKIKDFLADIERAVDLGATHLSIYTLTFEARTPIGRAQARGRIEPVTDDTLAEFYESARERLAQLGFVHEEVSNWAKPGYSCQHNALYWQDQPFLGVGVGAHGYIDGIRYQYRSDDRRFLRKPLEHVLNRFEPNELESVFDVLVDRRRDVNSWLMEYIGSGLRSQFGIDRERIESRGRIFLPSSHVIEGLKRGMVIMDEDGKIFLHPREWFRETAWSLELIKSFPLSQ